MPGWVLTISYVDAEGGQTDCCWGITEEAAHTITEQMGTPKREYFSSPESNAARRAAEKDCIMIERDEDK